MQDLKFTGERLVTSLNGFHGVTEHLHRYAIALDLAKDKIVLDIASGEGYGSKLLSLKAKEVIGVEIDNEVVEFANAKYGQTQKNLKFIQGSAIAIPLKDKSVDMVVSFETIEHLIEQNEMMKEVVRVIKDDGIFLISSPEKSIYKLRDPDNPFHLKELLLSEFKTLMEKYFPHVLYFNQRFVFGSLIHCEQIEQSSKFGLYGGNYQKINNVIDSDKFYNKPFFNLAICSKNKVDMENINGNSFFDGVNVLHQELSKIENVENELKTLMNSTSYKLGTWIVKKLIFLKKFKS